MSVPDGVKILGDNGLVKYNTKLESMTIPLNYEIDLDITPNDRIMTDWVNILHR